MLWHQGPVKRVFGLAPRGKAENPLSGQRVPQDLPHLEARVRATPQMLWHQGPSPPVKGVLGPASRSPAENPPLRPGAPAMFDFAPRVSGILAWNGLRESPPYRPWPLPRPGISRKELTACSGLPASKGTVNGGLSGGRQNSRQVFGLGPCFGVSRAAAVERLCSARAPADGQTEASAASRRLRTAFVPPPWQDAAPQKLLRIDRPCRRRRRSPPPQGPTLKFDERNCVAAHLVVGDRIAVKVLGVGPAPATPLPPP
jgi:hypothetical protein